MGQSLDVYVFYGAKLPDQEDSDNPRPQLNDAAVEALEKIGRDVDDLDPEDWWWELEKLFPELDILHVGVSDYTTPHIAIKETVKRNWSGDLISLKELSQPESSEARLQEALRYLKWMKTDYDVEAEEEVHTEVVVPDIEFGWWAGANWG